MINTIGNKRQINPRQVSFTSVPIFNVNVPKLVNNAYELTPALFSRLDILDPQDIQTMHKFKHQFTYKLYGESFPDMFLSQNPIYVKDNSFYALEVPSADNGEKELLGLLSTDNQSTKTVWKDIFVDIVNVREDLQKHKFSIYNIREYKNVGELLMYGIGKIADNEGVGFGLTSGNDAFYNRIRMPHIRSDRYFGGQALKDFLIRVEDKFKLSNTSVNITSQSS